MPPTKTEQLTRRLRNEIASGHFRPGALFPSISELEEQFGMKRTVVQLAVKELRQDGFVESDGGKRMKVSDTPPHLSQYGIVFAATRSSPERPRFDEAVCKEAAKIEQQGQHRFRFYEGATDPDEGAAVTARLRADIEARRLGGLLLFPGTHECLGNYDNELLCGVPHVFVCGFEPNQEWQPQINIDMDAFIDRALADLAAKGRKRVCLVYMAGTLNGVDPSPFERHGLTFRRAWMQAVGRSHPEVARGLVHILLDYPDDERPDAMIIADDNLVEATAAGLVETGLRVGKDIDVVAHCNWPWPIPSILPVRRLGFHAGTLLQEAGGVLDALRHKLPAPAVTHIAPVFEEEAKTPNPLASR